MRKIVLLLSLLFVVNNTGCGGSFAVAESCHTAGDEDGNGVSDCYDPVCARSASCLTVCGNGKVEPQSGELCDDDNSTNGDGCDINCTVTVCGNGIATQNEACDDGNITSGDGCDNNCMVTGCGNGIKTSDEVCDDGNTTNGDGCDNNCTTTACGNAIVAGTEACDDGNTTDGDGCDNNCVVSGCGNGIVAGTEACDDNNTTNGDGCDNNCTATACGNAIASGTEVCDDGNTTNGDGCDNNCTATACGNAIVSGTEACDDGNTNADDGCDNNCNVATCAALHKISPSSPNGVYLIDPDGAGSIAPFNAYCDMTTAGGGWTLVGRHGTGSWPELSEQQYIDLVANPTSDIGGAEILDPSLPAAKITAWFSRAKTNAIYHATPFDGQSVVRIDYATATNTAANGTYYQKRIIHETTWDFWRGIRDSTYWGTSLLDYSVATYGTDFVLTNVGSDFDPTTNSVTHNSGGDTSFAFWGYATITLADATTLQVSHRGGLLCDGWADQEGLWLFTLNLSDPMFKNEIGLHQSVIWLR